MAIFAKIKKCVANPSLLPLWFIGKGCLNWMDDAQYLKIVYFLKQGKRLHLDNPITFTEKLQWLKLHNRRPEYTVMVDKVKAKEYAGNIIGREYIIPTLGVWDNPDEIDFDRLPNQFVLKCNHNSGRGMCVCRDKSHLNIPKVIAELKRGLNENYYLAWREWPYKDVPRKVFAEQYMVEERSQNFSLSGSDLMSDTYDSRSRVAYNAEELTDYKFFCFNGAPFMMYVSHDNSSQATTDFFDMSYNHLPLRMRDPNSETLPEMVPEFEEMKRYAAMLSKGIPHARIDFYVINHHVYFGEITFFHNAGFTPIYPVDWDKKLGDLIHLK